MPEEGSLVEAERTVDEVFEFLSGKQVQIKDIFRLGRFKRSQLSSSHPRPLLIKLCTAWDRKLILLRKTKLKEFRIKRLFLREDVAHDHKLRQRQSDPSSKSNAPSSALDAAPIPASSRSVTPVPHRVHLWMFVWHPKILIHLVLCLILLLHLLLPQLLCWVVEESVLYLPLFLHQSRVLLQQHPSV